MLSLFSRFLFFKKPSQYFFVFDIGGFSVKALFVEIAGVDETPVILAHANEVYEREALLGDILSSPEALYVACKNAHDTLKRKVPSSKTLKDVVLGLSGGFVSGKTTMQFYTREYPDQEVNQTELKYILQHAEQRAYEEIRKEFAQDTGRPDTEAYLFNSIVQEVKIDGYRIANPLNFMGQEISMNIFNSYISRVHASSMMQIFDKLGLKVSSLVYSPLAMHQSLLSAHSVEEDALFIDIGGSETILAVTRKGKLENVNTIAVGGNAFTQKLARELKVGFWEAEHIKMRYGEDRLSQSVMRKITNMFDVESKVFLRGLELVLKDISTSNLLPSNVYLYGGTSSFSLIQKIFKRTAWRNTLSFANSPKFHIVDQKLFPVSIYDESFSYTPLWAPALSLAQFGAEERKKKDDVLAKTLRRMVKIIQE